MRLASLQPPVAKVQGPVGQREIAVVRFALRSTVEGRSAQEMVSTRMFVVIKYYGDDDDAAAEQAEFEGGKASSWEKGAHNALQGDDVAAAESAQRESCTTTDDERHANGDGAKHRWICCS